MQKNCKEKKNRKKGKKQKANKESDLHNVNSGFKYAVRFHIKSPKGCPVGSLGQN
jgi:hypothetical protein